MSDIMKLYCIWIGITSFLCAMAFLVDKRASFHKEKQRIPEIVLLTLITLGGCLGGLFGIFCLRHKRNRHTKFHFHVLTFLSCIVQLGILSMILLKQGGTL